MLRIEPISFVFARLGWLELKKEYKNLQREAMNKLKKQLYEKPSADSSQAGHQAKKQLQDHVDLSKKKNQNKSSQEDSQAVKDLPYTPGVVLKFNCQSHGTTKKELKVRKKILQIWILFLLLGIEIVDFTYFNFRAEAVVKTWYIKHEYISKHRRKELKIRRVAESNFDELWSVRKCDKIIDTFSIASLRPKLVRKRRSKIVNLYAT